MATFAVILVSLVAVLETALVAVLALCVEKALSVAELFLGVSVGAVGPSALAKVAVLVANNRIAGLGVVQILVDWVGLLLLGQKLADGLGVRRMTQGNLDAGKLLWTNDQELGGFLLRVEAVGPSLQLAMLAALQNREHVVIGNCRHLSSTGL